MRPGKQLAFIGSRSLSKTLTVTGLFCALLSFGQPLFAARSSSPLKCSQIFSSTSTKAEAYAAAQFLHQNNPQLHLSPLVESQVQKYKRQTGITLQKPADKIAVWLNYLDRLSQKAGQSPKTLQQLKDIIDHQYVIQAEDVPDSYYQLQAKMARDRGHGNITITSEHKRALAETVITDQKKSLDPWIEFMVEPEMNIYPLWTKYWMFTGMTKLSKYNPADGSFGNRSKGTVAPYPELNREAVSLVMEMILKRLDKTRLEEIKDPQLLQLIQNANFGKMYGHALKFLGGAEAGRFATTEGRWVRYNQGSDPTALVKSLEGKNTGWCTAGEATAREQLQGGDFYVYYSLDAEGQATNPRLAIRMQKNEITEIRGVDSGQNFDPQIAKSQILSEKLKEFGDRGQKYLQKDQDMKWLTDLDRKTKLGLPFSREDLLFLYEIDHLIAGFGWKADPRIAEIRSQRNMKEDFAALFGEPNGIQAIHGNLDLSYLTSAEGITLPRSISGDLRLSGLTSAKGLVLPQSIGGYLFLTGLFSAEGLVVPKSVVTRTIIPAAAFHRAQVSK